MSSFDGLQTSVVCIALSCCSRDLFAVDERMCLHVSTSCFVLEHMGTYQQISSRFFCDTFAVTSKVGQSGSEESSRLPAFGTAPAAVGFNSGASGKVNLAKLVCNFCKRCAVDCPWARPGEGNECSECRCLFRRALKGTKEEKSAKRKQIQK